MANKIEEKGKIPGSIAGWKVEALPNQQVMFRIQWVADPFESSPVSQDLRVSMTARQAHELGSLMTQMAFRAQEKSGSPG